MLKHSEYSAHTIALAVSVIGPLINLMLGFKYASSPPGMYLYWTLCLLLYIVIIIPFTYKFPLTFVRLIILGITLEDFSSHVWHSLILGDKFLPFCNWYTEHFPMLGNLGEPTPYVLIPRWYFVALTLYVFITIFQYKMYFESVKKTISD